VSNTLSKCHRDIPCRASGLVQIAKARAEASSVLETLIAWHHLLFVTVSRIDCIQHPPKLSTIKDVIMHDFAATVLLKKC
jgi:hypothetical protein